MAMKMDVEKVLEQWSDIENEESELSSDEDDESDKDPPEQTRSEFAGWRESM